MSCWCFSFADQVHSDKDQRCLELLQITLIHPIQYSWYWDKYLNLSTAGWSSSEISQWFSQLTVRLSSTHCRILHYLFDFTYSFRFIISLYLWYNLSQEHIHESCIWMIHVHPYSQSSKLLQLKLSYKVLRDKRHPDTLIMMHLKHEHICSHLSRWHKGVFLCSFCFEKNSHCFPLWIFSLFYRET